MPQTGNVPLERSEKVGCLCVKSKDPNSKPLPWAAAPTRRGIFFEGEYTMKQNSRKSLLSFFLCVVLIAALALSMTGCKESEEPQTTEPATFQNGATIGEGATEFSLVVVGKDGSETSCTVRTDKETVGDALLDLGIVSGEDSQYGLMILTVNGEYHRYEEDQYYWAFYIGEEYAITGVSGTAIEAGVTYRLVAESA